MKDLAHEQKWRIETSLLAPGGTLWSNLGAWPVPTAAPPIKKDDEAGQGRAALATDYILACENLATFVGSAAQLGPGMRVLDIACGYGESLAHWAKRFGVKRVDAVELRASCTAALTENPPECLGFALAASARDLGEFLSPAGPLPRGSYDALLCVDAAYHFGEPSPFFRAATELLRPGGILAWTTFTRRHPHPRAALGLLQQVALKVAQIPPSGLLSLEDTSETLASAGLDLITAQHLDREVLAGFANFVQRRRGDLSWRQRLRPAWGKIAGTAAIARRLAEDSPLHYTLLAARRRSTGDART